jgi:hypothetical protein
MNNATNHVWISPNPSTFSKHLSQFCSLEKITLPLHQARLYKLRTRGLRSHAFRLQPVETIVSKYDHTQSTKLYEVT